MTEKSLLLKCDFAGHYFIVGTDFPAARVFDTATSSLAAVVELPLRSRTVSLAALTLTSVAICEANEETSATVSRVNSNATARHHSEALLDDKVTTYYAAVGLSNGTVILHDVRRDVQLGHVQVSETQQSIVSLQICSGYAFCLAANYMLYVLSVENASAGPCLRLRVQPDASSIAVTTLNALDTPGATTTPNAQTPTASHRVFRVLVAGPTNALYEMRVLASHPNNGRHRAMAGSATANVEDTPQIHTTKLLAFPSQGTSAEFAWVSNVIPSAVCTGSGGGASDTPASLPAITASAQDGVVRVWDVQYTPSLSSAAAPLLTTTLDTTTASSTAVVARCRRTLLCGQRMLNVCVLPNANNGTRKGNYVMVTTLTGSVLLWSLGDCILPPVVEPVPLKPDVVLVSAVAAGRLLFGTLRPASGVPTHVTASGNPLRALEMTLLRGRFALPMFETKNIGDAVDQASCTAATPPSVPEVTGDAAAGPKQKAKAVTTNVANARRTALATLALGMAGTNASAITVVELPLNTTHASLLANQRDAEYLLQHTTDTTTSAFVVMDTVWAAHQRQVAAKANQSMTDAFKAPQLYHAKSIQCLPVKQYTLEQRLQQVARDEAAAAARRRQLAAGSAAAAKGASDTDNALEQLQIGAAETGRSVVSHHALGLATVPLYQALHANDTAAVMDLLNMTARSAEGMRATVLSLQLPYCLQLLHLISERLGMCSKAVEKVAPPSESDVGHITESPVATAKSEQASHAGGAHSDSTTADAASAQPADENVSSVSGTALRGGGAAFSIRSSLVEWIDAIVHYRGTELLAVQRDWDAREAADETREATRPTVASPPKDFLAPILHHYESLCSQYDKLAVLYGRLSIFKSVRPSQKNDFTNIPRKCLSSNLEMGRPVPAVNGGLVTSSTSSKRHLHLAGRSSVVDDDIIFPVMFKESRSRSGHRVVRVRSKLEIEKKRRQRKNRDAALHKHARALAQKQLGGAKPGHSILDDDSDVKRGVGLGSLDVMDQIMLNEMGGKNGNVDLDALEAMDLGDDASDEDMMSDGSFDGEEEETGGSGDEEEAKSPIADGSKRKKARGDTAVFDEMLADARDGENSDEDYNEALDSSEAEFSSASDDEVDSDLADDDDDEDEESDADTEGSDVDDEQGESRDDVKAQTSDDDDDDDDGMDENMKELLSHNEDDGDRTDRRKTKKVRLD
ncbi:hypothetical protein JKF63_04157 [Porcisia hertigi]|uniref:Uncharacterized protein n=1 Tax=Porcisia hertigi TaxID=2761500 RepID=A0A836IB53_9TRYP|nr:hypothetical protein JKF63_04157 [Porcisia hertigi]